MLAVFSHLFCFFYFFVFEIEKYLIIDKCGFEFLKLHNIKPLIQKEF